MDLAPLLRNAQTGRGQTPGRGPRPRRRQRTQGRRVNENHPEPRAEQLEWQQSRVDLAARWSRNP
eukprot:4977134-Lingulodinium_polyedra.AAC.1